MLIGIDGSRAFIKNRTGIEEYSYQVIKHLRDELQSHQVVLYVRKNQLVDFDLPENWKIKVIKFPKFWTQLGLSLEMILHPVETLFIPAHTVPIIHPKNSIVVMHGLEYEHCLGSYPLLDRLYMRVSIKRSCQWASKIVAVSKNTERDLMKMYGVPENKIEVIYEGYEKAESEKLKAESKMQKPYLLFVGRIEERKNIVNVIRAFEILKEKYNVSHKLVLAGKPGHNYNNIKLQITNSKYQKEIMELGFVSEEEKWVLLKDADAFVFPTLYEGFGIPVLEAQSVGCPVVASNNSSIPEVVEDSAMLVDPEKPEDIAENLYELISNETLKNDIIRKGLENVKRFSWDECARAVAEILVKRN